MTQDATAVPGETPPDSTIPGDAKADLKTEKPAETQTPETTKPAEGTPDKALQQVQQTIAAFGRKLDAALAKPNLSAEETQKLQRAQERLDRFTQMAGKPADQVNYDELASLAPDLMSELVEGAKHRGDTAKRIADLESQKNELANQVAVLSNMLTYPDVKNQQAIWEKAWADAAETLGPEAPAGVIWKLADKEFHQRCGAAQTRAERAAGDEQASSGGATTGAAAGRTQVAKQGAPAAAPGSPMAAHIARREQRALRMVRKAEE